jgi:hypothetical protein
MPGRGTYLLVYGVWLGCIKKSDVRRQEIRRRRLSSRNPTPKIRRQEIRRPTTDVKKSEADVAKVTCLKPLTWL